jgi:UDP-N-acetylmuramoylalanine--D-glutamate ligase
LKPEDVKGKRFSIIGGARSGIAVAKLLKSREAQVFLSDKSPTEKMQQAIEELRATGIQSEFGGNTGRVLDAEVVVLSPGVPSDLPLVKAALAKGLSVVSEVEVASWFSVSPVVAITGTNGKTTTTALTGRMFQDAKRPCVVGGNIGTAFSQLVGQVGSDGVAILEISSFQLDHIVTFRPRVAVWLNVTPDHLDRYEHSYEKYIASKCRVFENQGSGDVLICNADDETERTAVRKLLRSSVRKLEFSLTSSVREGAYIDNGFLTFRLEGVQSAVIRTEDISIPGRHNLYNAMAASLAARMMGISEASIRATLRNFKGVEHRLEFVGQIQGVTYVNDSKATNVDSVWYALQSFKAPIVLLLGGRDKGNDYSRLSELVRHNVKAIVAIGESADKVVKAFKSLVPIQVSTSMADAVHTAASLAGPGDVVLLSPACASFDWFENYEHRGRVFKQLVTEIRVN